MKRKALFTSILALLLCVSMLVGTTYAWFTDTASTGINTIQSGNLDIEVLYAYPSDVVDGEIPDNAWKVVNANTPVFNQDALWEPGYTEVVYLKYVNKGSLSLQFQMHVDILKEVSGINVAGELFTLSDYIEAYVCGAVDYQFELYEARDEALNPPFAPDVWHGSLKEVANMAVATPSDPDTWLSLDTWNWLEPAEEYYTTLVLFMPTTVGNEANFQTGEMSPSIDLGINVIATQYNWENEKDSYDHNYDKDAQYPVLVSDAASLEAALNSSESAYIKLTDEINESITFSQDLANKTIDADGNNVAFTFTGDLDNVVVTGIVDTADEVPAITVTSATTGDITISNSVLYSGTKAPYGAIAGNGASTNLSVTVENCELVSGGDKYGAYITNGKDFTFKNCTFTGFKSWAILINGTVTGNIVVDGCTFEDCAGILKAGVSGTADWQTGKTGNITFTNNILNNNTLKDGKYFATNSVGTVTVSGNTGNDTEEANWTNGLN